MYIGVDLGGTNIAVGLVDEKGNLIATKSTPTLKERAPEEITNDMIKLSKELLKENGYEETQLEGIGIGFPGTVDDENGKIIYAANLNMDGFMIADYIKKYIDVPVRLANDADCAAMGEYTVYEEDVKDFIFVTLGTGVGGGIIKDGKLQIGFNGMTSELGHISLISGGEECGCGKKGCWEAYASVTALVRQTKKAMEEHPESIMKNYLGKDGSVNGRTSFDAAKAGDSVAKEVVSKYVTYVADGLVSIENMLQPEAIVIGGGISKEGEYLLNPIMDYVNKYRFNKKLKQTKIKIAKLYNDAGIIGAAMLCK